MKQKLLILSLAMTVAVGASAQVFRGVKMPKLNVCRVNTTTLAMAGLSKGIAAAHNINTNLALQKRYAFQGPLVLQRPLKVVELKLTTPSWSEYVPTLAHPVALELPDASESVTQESANAGVSE